MKRKSVLILALIFALAILLPSCGKNTIDGKPALNEEITSSESSSYDEGDVTIDNTKDSSKDSTNEYKNDNIEVEVPEGKPLPVDTEDIVIDDSKTGKCTISICLSTIFDNIENLDPEKKELLPSDGYVLKETVVSFSEGESVFDVLYSACKDNKIHFEFVHTPVYDSAYIEGINNIYEFDCGELSGWMYKVNGWFPSYGCSRYLVQDGDKIEWIYSCDLGRDIGAGME